MDEILIIKCNPMKVTKQCFPVVLFRPVHVVPVGLAKIYIKWMKSLHVTIPLHRKLLTV